MISITNTLFPLNDQYEIVDDETSLISRFSNIRNIGSSVSTFFKKYLNVFRFICKLYNYFLTAANVVYYFVCICMIGLVFFYGYRALAFLTRFFIGDIYNYLKKKESPYAYNNNAPNSSNNNRLNGLQKNLIMRRQRLFQNTGKVK